MRSAVARRGALENRGHSDSDQLRQVIEVLVSRVEGKVVLQYQRRQPHVVRWNRRALFAKLPEHGRVMMRRLVVSEEDADAVLQQKTPQGSLVLRRPSPVPSTRASIAASFRLLPSVRARSRRASSTAGGIPRIVYCMHRL